MKKRITGMLLVTLIVFNSIGFNVAKAEEVGTTETHHYELDGKEFDATKTVKDGTTTIEITSPTLEGVLKSVITDEYVTTTYNGTSCTKSLLSDLPKFSSVNYGHTVRAKVDDRYYYCYGSSGSKDYIKIGCIENYQIRTDNLSSDRKTKINTYVNKLLSSNDYYDKAVARLGTTGVAYLATLAGIMMLEPAAAIIGVTVAGFTGTLEQGIEGIVAYQNAKHDMQDSADVYDIIKTYGTKL